MLEVSHSFHRLKKVNLGQVLDLPEMDFYLLHIIEKYWENSHGQKGIYVSEIAGKAHIASSQVSRTLKNLEQKQLIHRSVDSKDRRNTYVYLSDKGNEFCQQANALLEELSNKVISRFGEERIDELINLCNELSDTMEQELKKKSKPKGKSQKQTER
jgi:DNA-binding MarR family transcriptional regulator